MALQRCSTAMYSDLKLAIVVVGKEDDAKDKRERVGREGVG
jgi:hypothetical protein